MQRTIWKAAAIYAVAVIFGCGGRMDKSEERRRLVLDDGVDSRGAIAHAR